GGRALRAWIRQARGDVARREHGPRLDEAQRRVGLAADRVRIRTEREERVHHVAARVLFEAHAPHGPVLDHQIAHVGQDLPRGHGAARPLFLLPGVVDGDVGGVGVLEEQRARVAGEEAVLHAHVVRPVADRDAVVPGAGRRYVAEDDVVRGRILCPQVVGAVAQADVADDDVVATHVDEIGERTARDEQRRTVALHGDEVAVEARQRAADRDRLRGLEADDRVSVLGGVEGGTDRVLAWLRHAQLAASRSSRRRCAEALDRFGVVVSWAAGWRRPPAVADGDRHLGGGIRPARGDRDTCNEDPRLLVDVLDDGARAWDVARRRQQRRR